MSFFRKISENFNRILDKILVNSPAVGDVEEKTEEEKQEANQECKTMLEKFKTKKLSR